MLRLNIPPQNLSRTDDVQNRFARRSGRYGERASRFHAFGDFKPRSVCRMHAGRSRDEQGP